MTHLENIYLEGLIGEGEGLGGILVDGARPRCKVDRLDGFKPCVVDRET